MALRHSHRDRFSDDPSERRPRPASPSAPSGDGPVIGGHDAADRRTRSPSAPMVAPSPSPSERLRGLLRAGVVSVLAGLALAVLLTAVLIAAVLLAVSALS